MADCEFFHLNAGAHHFVNVLIHAANSALLFWFLFRLTQKIWPATVIAALFAWHPLHVESVAWVAERKDVLSTFFALLTLLCYEKSARRGARSYWLALLFFALGLLAKPMLVTLPFVMLLLDFWPLNRFDYSTPKKLQPLTFNRQLFFEKWPFFLLTVVSCVVTFFAQRAGAAVVSLVKIPLLYRLENAPVAVAGYLQNFFWPANLCALYPLPNTIAPLKIILSVVTVVLISAAAWRWRQTKPYVLMGWIWFLGMLVPVIGLVQVGGQASADRYTYLPSIGLFIALVFLAREVALKIQLPKIVAAGGIFLVGAACIAATEHQLQFWRDGESLFRRAAAVTKNNSVALVDLGVALDAQGRFEEGLAAYRQAAKIDPSRYQIFNNMGNILGLLGRHAESVPEYREAIRLRPDIAFLHFGLGRELAALGQWAAALAEFSEAERCDDNYGAPHLETAKILFKQGQDAEAVAEMRAALRLDPGNYQTLATIAHYLAAHENPAIRDGPNARLLAIQANELSGHRQPMVFDILGMALAATGDFTNAQVCARNALELATTAQLKNTEGISQRLERYKINQPWLESFRLTNQPGRFQLLSNPN